MENVLTSEGLHFGYHNRNIVENFGLSIRKGEMASIVGPNGSGKSTVLRLLTRLVRPNKGIVYLEGEAIALMNTKQVARKLTMLPQTQDPNLDLTVRDLVKQGRHPHLKWYEECRNEHEDAVDWALQMTDMTKLQHRSLYTLSGGERQRAWIAMAVAQTPHTLLLDEPTTYLDVAHQLEVMELLQFLNRKQGITIVMVMHDLNQASRYSDRIIAMKDGKLVSQGSPAEVFLPDFFSQVFGIEANVYEDEGKPVYTPRGLAISRKWEELHV
ncbi:ABC transporter ATP-binding protein [Cohnella silvisoli]|uniref:ABC transporter ATP-binding protein n=1 Tax=Cohnella silvisoli TaxID=2873699 RepID=A0ABV1L039_9BACL|nr:ABC transporter ATP-binding protein [Cohnella silvisoli]MCD9024443.1 ABC transporter ATP-binding protein [Cohnella silvisoli]